MRETPPRSIPEAPPDAGRLLVMVYDELRRLASRQMARQGDNFTLQPTALVHEAWLRLAAGESGKWKDRTHFFRTAAMAMRRILVDRAREKGSAKRGGHLEFVLDGGTEVVMARDNQLLIIDECLERMEQENPECARIVQLKFFAGLSNEETAALLELSLRSVERQWAFARTKLFQMIRDQELSA